MVEKLNDTEVILAIILVFWLVRETLGYIFHKVLRSATTDYIERKEFDLHRLEIERNFVSKDQLHKDLTDLRKEVLSTRDSFNHEIKEIKEEIRQQKEILTKIFFKLSG